MNPSLSAPTCRPSYRPTYRRLAQAWTLFALLTLLTSPATADPVTSFVVQADSVLTAGGESALSEWLEGRQLLVGAAAAQVLDIAVQFGDAGDEENEAGNVAFVRSLATAEEARGELSPARRLLDEFESWDSTARADRRLAVALRAAADSVRAAGDADAAVERLQRADAIYERIGDTHSRAIVAGSLGVAHWYRGDFDAVGAAYLRALDLRREVGDAILEGKTLNGLGSMNFATGDYAEAVSWYERAAELRRRSGDLSGLGTSLTYAGHARLQLGEIVAARKLYEEALPVLREVGSVRQVVENLIGTADLYDLMGRYRDAVSAYEDALSLCRGAEDCDFEGLALQNLAATLRNAGDLREAARRIEEAAAVVDGETDPATAARIRLNWASTALDLGDEDLAKSKAREALALSRRTGDAALQCDAQTALASLFLNIGEYDRARRGAESALQAALDLDDPARQREAHVLLGGVRLRLGNGESAAISFGDALRIDEASEARLYMAEDLLGRGGAYSVAGDLEAARVDLRRARFLLEDSDSEWSWLVALNLADSFEESDPDSAAIWYARALDELDATSMSGGAAALGGAYLFADRGRAYEGIGEFYARQFEETEAPEWLERAYGVAERSRARGLLDLLEHSFALESSDASVALIDSLYSLDASLPQARDERRRLRQRLSELRRSTSPGRTPTQPATLEELQGALDGDTVLFQYALGDSASWLFVVNRAETSLHRLPARGEFERSVRSLRDAIAQPGAGDATLLREARRLYLELIGPAESTWKSARHRVVIPDGVLFELPFEVLLEKEPAPEKAWREQPFLVRSAAPVYAPSATVYLQLQKARAVAHGEALLAVGDVDYSKSAESLAPLPFTRDEVQSIRPSKGSSTLLLGPEASETRLKRALRAGSPRVLHLAAHGLVDAVEPARSSIALAASDDDDGFFHSLEILATPMPDCLVVLSACESALGRQSRGEGVVGLTRSFLAAGAKGVVASLWPVVDESTATFMRAFYRDLWQQQRASEALQGARLELLDSDAWQHPLYWAAFVVVGSGS